MLADGEEGREYALVSQRLDHCGGGRPRAIVEGQDDFLFTQEVMLLEMLETKSRPAGGIDLYGTRNAECVGILTCWFRVCGSIGAAGLCFGNAPATKTRPLAPVLAGVPFRAAARSRRSRVPASAIFAGKAARFWAVPVPTRLKLMSPPATATAAAEAKTIVLRIRVSPCRSAPGTSPYRHPNVVKIRYGPRGLMRGTRLVAHRSTGD